MQSISNISYIDSQDIHSELTGEHKKLRSKVYAYALVFLGMIIISGFTFMAYSMITHKNTNNLSSQGLTKTSLALQKDSIHFNDGRIYTIDGINIIQVEDLTINFLDTTFFDTSLFPNLKRLSISQNLKIQNLVINNSKIVQYSLNSTELLSLTLINNALMTSFINSNLPSLTKLSVISSNIKIWNSNQFGKLQKLIFLKSLIETLPNLDLNILSLEVCYCGKVSILPNQFSQYQRIQSLLLEQTEILNDVNSLEIKTRSLSLLRIIDCSLQNLSIVSENLSELFIDSNVNFSSLNLSIKNITKLTIDSETLTEFKIDTNNLLELYLQCQNLQKMQYQIPGLQKLNLTFTKLTNDDFSKFAYHQLKQLSLSHNFNLRSLENKFEKLEQLTLQGFSNWNFKSLLAPSLIGLTVLDVQQKLLSSDDFPQHSYLTIKNSNVSRIQSGQHVKHLQIYNSRALDQNIMRVNFNKKNKLETIRAYNSLINIIQQELKYIKQIQLVSTELVYFLDNNVNSNFSFLIIQSSEVALFDNNIFGTKSADGAFIVRDSHVGMGMQHFDHVRLFSFENTHPSYIGDYLQRMPRVEQLYITKQQFQSISGYVFNNLTIFQNTYNQKFQRFENNTLQVVKDLNLSNTNLNTFNDNKMPKLKTLRLKNTPKLTQDAILYQLTKLKSNGTILQTLYTDYNEDSMFKSHILSIFPYLIIH